MSERSEQTSLASHLMYHWNMLNEENQALVHRCWRQMSAESTLGSVRRGRSTSQNQHADAENSIPDFTLFEGWLRDCFGLSTTPRQCTVGFLDRTLFSHNPLVALFAATLLQERVTVMVYDEGIGYTESGIVFDTDCTVQFRPPRLSLFVNFRKHLVEPFAAALDNDGSWKQRRYFPSVIGPCFSTVQVTRALRSAKDAVVSQSRQFDFSQ
ncbi:MAG: hypothetical protein R3358_00145 [Woeseiaceae bacterium]|nr:hypothetical protein [Woeseiaceae bacterium]